MNREAHFLEFSHQLMSSPVLIAVQCYAGLASLVFMVLLINRHRMNIRDSFMALYYLKPILDSNAYVRLFQLSIWFSVLVGILYLLYVVYRLES